MQGRHKASDTDEGISSDSECPTRVQSLLRQLQERDTQLARLEWQASNWQQKFEEEGTLRMLASDANHKPRSHENPKLLHCIFEKFAYVQLIINFVIMLSVVFVVTHRFRLPATFRSIQQPEVTSAAAVVATEVRQRRVSTCRHRATRN